MAQLAHHAAACPRVWVRRPGRGPAPCRSVVPGSGAPGSGQLIVEFAAAGNVKALTRLLDIEYSIPDEELDSSTKAIRTAQLRTAAQRAVHAGMIYTLRLLLERGADLGLDMGNGRAIACEAAARGQHQVLALLLAPHDPPESIGGGVSTEVQNGHGRTVLMEAAMNGHAECLRVAIEAGVTNLWWKYVGAAGHVIGIDRFGLSAPGNVVMQELGITADKVVEAVENL